MKIQIYTTKNCSHCQRAKEYFKSLNLDYESYDIGSDPKRKQELIDAGYVSVPVIKVGNETLVGWDKNTFESLMKRTNL